MPAEIFFVSFHPCIMFSEVWFTYGLCAVLFMELSITHVLLYVCHAFAALYVSASMSCINIHVQFCGSAVVFSQSLFCHKYEALLRLLGQAFIQCVVCCLPF